MPNYDKSWLISWLLKPLLSKNLDCFDFSILSEGGFPPNLLTLAVSACDNQSTEHASRYCLITAFAMPRCCNSCWIFNGPFPLPARWFTKLSANRSSLCKPSLESLSNSSSINVWSSHALASLRANSWRLCSLLARKSQARCKTCWRSVLRLLPPPLFLSLQLILPLEWSAIV